MRPPSVLAFAVAFVVVAALAPASGCARKKAAPAPSPLVERGRQAYAKFCATCHGPAANGYLADNAPSLRSSTFLESATDAFISAGINRGRPGTAMAAFASTLGGPLAPAEVDAIVAFLRAGGPAFHAVPTGPIVGDVKRGKVLYDATCARCHGTQTQRSSAVHLANPVFLATASDGFLRWAIEMGRPPTSMVPWKGTLNPTQIDDVVAFVRSMAVTPGTPALPSAITQASAPLPPRQGPIVLNPRGKAPDFVLKEDLYVSIAAVKKALDDKRRLIIADARPPSDWLNLHITGAILDALLRHPSARRPPQRRHLGPRLLRLSPPRLGPGRRRAAQARLQTHRGHRRGGLRLAAGEVSGRHRPRPVAGGRAAAAASLGRNEPVNRNRANRKPHLRPVRAETGVSFEKELA